MSAPVTRRDFIRAGAAVGGGLLVGVRVPARWGGHAGAAAASPVALNAYVEIGTDGAITITVPCPEIGQGVRTALPMVVAEELGADWAAVTVRQAAADGRYGGMTVGGSDSVRDYWEPLRRAGATAREMLRSAAARQWNVDPSSCRVARGAVTHLPSGRRLGFGDVAARAGALPVPAGVTLKDPTEFTIIGTPVSGVDVPAIATGSAIYGLDVRRVGMLFAVVARPPVHGARVRTFDASAALRVPGVRRVVEIAPRVTEGQWYGAVRGGIAVLAENTWAAMRGRDALRVTWDRGRFAAESSAAIEQRLGAAAAGGGEGIVRSDGDAPGQLRSSARAIEATYRLPLLAHVLMEPVNFTAQVAPGRCTVWGPTQDPRYLQSLLAAALRLPGEAVEVHPTLAGGGFGRRLAVDYGVEAALVAREVGTPVQVVWTREDDVRHDYYRTPSQHRLRAVLDATGRVVAWYHHVVTASLVRHLAIPPPDGRERPPGLYDVQGAADMPYAVDHVLVEYSPVEVGLQMGSWRSVAHSFNVFVVESFVDELAVTAPEDSLAFRLRMLAGEGDTQLSLPLPGRRGRPRFRRSLLRRALTAAADRAGWGTPLPPGSGRGIACAEFKGTYAAHVAEVSIDAGGELRVDRVVAALDCGLVVNPSGVRAQVEGAVMDGVATVLKWGITVADGQVQESNFHDYPLIRIDEAPEVDVVLLPSDRPPNGTGEPPYPSVAPAIANAVFAASGVRIRRLPLRSGDLRR